MCYRSEIPAKSFSLELDDTSIDFPLTDQRSNTSKLLATLLEADAHGWVAYEPALKNVRKKVASFALGHGDSVQRIKAIMVYTNFARTRYFNSRKQVQTPNGFYNADFQLLCLELGRLLEDSAFAFLAKQEMLFAWVDLIDLPDKPSGIHGEQLQKLFTMMPFSDDFLAEFRYKHKQKTDLPRKLKASMEWYNASSKQIHIESWKEVAVHTKDQALAEPKMPQAAFRPVRDIAKPRKMAKHPILPNTPVFHRRPGDKYAHLFVQRDAYKDFKGKKEFNFKPREPSSEWW